MAEIANVQLTEFANHILRGLADQVAHLDAVMPAVQAGYIAKNLGTVINDAGPGNLIADGSETDGRTRRSGGDVYNLMTFLSDFQTFMTSDRRNVVLGWQVNGVLP